MPTQRYSVTQPPIENLFTWIRSGEVAIPEIQRPFVWDAIKVRNFLDSLFQGFPVGYLIAWKNPDVKLKDGTTASGKRILIDGQQRVTALMASLLGREVVTKDYRQVQIRIAFHPVKQAFEVSNPAIAKDRAWLPDIATVFAPETSMLDLVTEYCASNSGTNKDDIFRSLERLKGITSNQIGLIELASELDIDTVTEIFIRVNSEGVPLSQADFAMSKIAVNETYGGSTLRRAIDYFCHLAIAPEFYSTLKQDEAFARTDYFKQMSWLKSESEDLYDPSYTDMLRVAFTSEFKRGRLADLVALLSGRNFATKQYEDTIVEDSFTRLKSAVGRYMNENHFKTFTMIVRSAGFVDSSLIRSQNNLNFAYILYLTLRSLGYAPPEIERHVRRWFVLSVLTGRYSGSPESAFDQDIRRVHEQGIEDFSSATVEAVLSPAFWEAALPQAMNVSAASSPYFCAFLAAQVKMNDRGFLSSDITVHDLVTIKSDVHHIFPKGFLKKEGMTRRQYNQIANYAATQSDINIAIGGKAPTRYLGEMLEQCNGGERRYGNITDVDSLRDNYQMNCIPEGIEDMDRDDYPAFLDARRLLMAAKIREYFKLL